MGYDEAKEHLTEGVPQVAIRRDIRKVTFEHDLSTGALSAPAGLVDKFRIIQVMVHASGALSDTTIKVSFDNAEGSDYDTLIGNQGFEGGQDIGLIAGENMLGVSGIEGDDIAVISTGTDAVGILYGTILYEKLT